MVVGLVAWGVALAVEMPAPLAELEKSGRGIVEPRPEAATHPVVIDGATVFTATGAVYAPGYVVLRDGRITAVGEGSAPVHKDAETIDARGRFVTPGLIDTHSHLGVYPSPGGRGVMDGNEATDPVTPGVWAEHSVWPQDPGFERAIAGGITALQILPGSANLIGGRGVVLEVVPRRGARAMRFPGAPETLKMACGENPKRVYGEGSNRAPSTRMGNLRGQREAFLNAVAYLRKWEDYDRELARYDEDQAKGQPKKGKDEPKDPPRPPERDLDAETLVGVLTGDVLPQVHCYRADDMLSMLQVADEFGFRVRSFHHALEAYKIRDVLAERGVAVSTWADWWGFKLEAYDGIPQNLALVEEAGGRPVVHSDDARGIQRLNQEAAKGYYAGLQAGIELTEDDAIRWVTANPAWALGIDKETGTLEAGKRGDVVVWSAHPLSVYAAADLVYVAGALEYARAEPGRPWSDFEAGQGVR